MRSASCLLACLLLACSTTAPAQRPVTAQAEPEPESRAWLSTLDSTHPLVGQVWDVASGKPVSLAQLELQVGAAQLVLIGEAHDNPDHHRLEAELLQAACAGGRKPAATFEMLDLGKQTLIDQTLAAHPGEVDMLGDAVDWAASGWPEWSLYRPVFAAAIGARLPIVAAGFDRDAAMQLARQGLAALDPQLVSRFALAVPLSAKLQTELRTEMRDAHCGLLPTTMLDTMALVQRARDALLAERMHSGAERAGAAVLIAGNGHVRNDRGVSAGLLHAYAARSLSIGLLEVQHDWLVPTRYAEAFSADRLPFDYVLFTPRASDEDHCAKLREQMQQSPVRP